MCILLPLSQMSFSPSVLVLIHIFSLLFLLGYIFVAHFFAKGIMVHQIDIIYFG